MSDKIQKNILSALLDKYERSSFFRDEKQPTRRIILKLYDGGYSDFPYYDIEQSERRISVNQAVAELAELDLVSYEWMRGELNHIIAKVWLNTEKLEFAYKEAGRKAKSDIVDDICLEILHMQDKVCSPWFKEFFNDAYSAVSRKRSLVSSIPAAKEDRNTFYTAICAIDKIKNLEITERVFSLQCFGDSKKFEREARLRVINLLRKYLECDDDTRDEDILRQVGIVKYPEQFEFCGKASLVIGTESVDFSPLRFGSSISISDLSRGDFTLSPCVKRILTIENRANYIEYIQKSMQDNELVIYHAGQYSPSKKQFFLAVVKAMSEGCIWEHWGDIDYGGFSMLARLRREVLNGIKPFRMNISELLTYEHLNASITMQYAEKIRSLIVKPELQDCYDCLNYLIEKKVRLEQESMLITVEI